MANVWTLFAIGRDEKDAAENEKRKIILSRKKLFFEGCKHFKQQWLITTKDVVAVFKKIKNNGEKYFYFC